MSRRLEALRTLFAALALYPAAAALLFAVPSVLAPRPAAGSQAAAVDLAGNPVDPLKVSPGKVVVLIFVRTDCPISNRYAPAIQKLSAEYSGKAAFFLVYPARAESPEMIRKHNEDFGYTLTALRDLQHSLVKLSRASITPEAAVFDAHHKLIYHGRIDDLYQDFGRSRFAPTTHELDDAIRAAISDRAALVDTAPAVGCYISDLE